MTDIERRNSNRNAKNPSSRNKLLPTLLAAGSILIFAGALYLRATYQLAQGSGPAGPQLSRQTFATPWTKRSVFFVGLGDSVTAGFGAPKGLGYFDRLVENPPNEFEDIKGVCLRAVFPRLTVTNLSVSGTVSKELVETQLPALPVSDAQVLGWVVITTGGNDLIHNYGRTPPREHAMYGATLDQAKPWIENFEHRLNSVVTNLGGRFPGGCQIFLASIYDPTDGKGDIEHAGLPAWPEGGRVLAAYNAVIQRCATKNKNVHVVDLHETFLGHGIHCGQFWMAHYQPRDPHYWYYSNLEDPNERGYDAIRRLFLLEMSKLANTLN